MTAARCLDCGTTFERDADEAWKKRCVPCYVKKKTAQQPTPATSAPVDPAYAEFLANLRELIQLTHPDRHGNSALSTRVSSWLLSVRNRVAERAR